LLKAKAGDKEKLSGLQPGLFAAAPFADTGDFNRRNHQENQPE